MKKESLSVMTVKTLLAVLLFAGIGTIIIGGGYIIGEYSKISNNQTNNKIWNSIHKCSEEHLESCDRSCNIDSDCIPSCTYNMGCIRSGEGQVGANAIRCEVAPFSCKCENNKCEIVEYEYKIKLSQSAEVLRISLPIEIEKMLFYSDGGTTGVISKDANGRDFFFCLDGRMQETKIGEEPEPYHIYFKATHPTDANAQKISISGEKEKAILNILQDWANKQVSEEEQIRLLNIRTVVGLSEEELKMYRILKVIKKLEDRNKIIDQPDTSDWQTYRNEEFGFEVKYPEEWYYNRDKQAEIKSDYSLHIGFTENMKTSNQDIRYPIEFMIWPDNIGILDSGPCEYEILKKKDNRQYVLRTCDFKTYEKTMDKMVESFRFIEEDNTSDWQTYRNEEFGFEFEIKYPESWIAWKRMSSIHLDTVAFALKNDETLSLTDARDPIFEIYLFSKKAWEVTQSWSEEYKAEKVKEDNKGNVFAYRINRNGHPEMIKQILSTFKFIEKIDK